MHINIFYKLPNNHKTINATRVATFEPASEDKDSICIHQFIEYLSRREGSEYASCNLSIGTRIIRPSSDCNDKLYNNCHIDIYIPVIGGKGGFGSLLRAIGAQIEKTTNRDACRDLKGRRLRDVKKEEKLKQLLLLQEKLVEERKKRKLDKLNKLKGQCSTYESDTSIQKLLDMFEDQDYTSRRLKINDIIKIAVKKGIIKTEKKEESSSSQANESEKELDNLDLWLD